MIYARIRILQLTLLATAFAVSCVPTDRTGDTGVSRKKRRMKVNYSLGLEDADRTTRLLGDLRAVVVLMEFPDCPIDKEKYPRERLEAFMFDKKAKGLGHYLAENSGGKYTISGSVYGWYVSKMTADEINTTPGGLEYSLGRLAKDAVRRVIREGIDPAEFDNDGPDGVPRSQGSTDDDGLIDELYIIPSGKVNCGICMMGQYADFAKRTTFLYLETSHGGFGNVGFYIHEMGHHFYFAWDHYGNHYQGEYGSGCWAQMGLGCWSQNGQVPRETVWTQPAHFTAFSKATLDWIEPRVITESTKDVKLTAMETKPDAVEVRIPGTLEYFLIENRQPIGYEDLLPGGGLLIFRCHRIWKGYFWLLQADGRADLQNGEPIGRPYPPTEANLADDGDPFPGSENNRLFGPETNPSSRSDKGLNSGITIKNISDSGDAMSFDVVIDANIQEGLKKITTIKGSLEELKSPNVIRRRNAAISLEEIADERAIDGLAEALTDEDEEVKLHVIKALGRIVTDLVRELKHRDQAVRENAAKTIAEFKKKEELFELRAIAIHSDGELAGAASDVLGELTLALEGEERLRTLATMAAEIERGPKAVRISRLQTLVKFNDPATEEAFLQCLQSNEPEILKIAAEGAGELKSKKAVPRLIQISENQETDEDVRLAALDALGKIGDESSAAAVCGLLEDPRFPVRFAAVRALHGINSKESLPALMAALRNEDINKGAARHGNIRHGIKGAIARIGADAVPELIRLLEDEEAPLGARPFAAATLGDIGDPTAVAPMVKLLLAIDSKREEWDQTEAVDHAVRNLHISLRKELALQARRIVQRKPQEGKEAEHEKAKAALDNLIAETIKWLKDRDPKRRMDGIDLLKNCAEKPAPDQFIAALKDKHPDVRKAAANAFTALKDERAMPALIELLDDRYYGVRYSAAWALGQLRDGKAVPALIERMEKETDRRVYAIIVRSLGDIGTPETARPLCRALSGPVYEARVTAARALGKHKEPFVIDALIAALPDNDFGTLIKRRRANVSWPRMRIWAMRSLAQIGEQKAIEPIKAYLTDDDLSCRYPAALALLRLSDNRTDGVSRPRLVKMADEYIEQTTDKELLEFVPREYLRR